MTFDAVTVGQSLVSRWGRTVRWFAVGVVALLMLIPLAMVESVVSERHATYRTVVADIAASWAGSQLLAGPILLVPYSEEVEVRDEYVTPQGEKKVAVRRETLQRRAVLLPDDLAIGGRLNTETRRRGIYKVQVFTAELEVAAEFGGLEAAVAALSSPDRLQEIGWRDAVIAFGLSDPRGIVTIDGLSLNGAPGLPRPGTTLPEILPRGLHVAVGDAVGDRLELRMPLVVRGSGGLQFLPLGETTRVDLSSAWPHPSFTGDILPATREVSGSGFTAAWTIPLLSRSYPQAWTAGAPIAVDEVEAGVCLFEPVALYDLVTRAVKYGLLFIALTFLTLGLIELVLGVRLRLVQFALIGMALAMFFLTLVALAEHVGFGVAYLLASATVVVINTLYTAAILRRRSTAVLVGGVLTAIYGILYTILEAEDFALLGGTALLLTALAVTMYFTRRINLPA